MASFKPFFFLFSLISYLCLYTSTVSAAPNYLYHNCSTNKTFTANSAFQFSLNTLLSSLSSNATGSTEFYNTTAGGTNTSDTVYGNFMCRGDVSSQACRECVINATQRLASECRSSKEAITWYDECQVRYSNRSIFSTVTERPRLGLLNTANISNADRFMDLLFDKMNKTADEAANKGPVGVKKYATKEANRSNFQTLYTLAQCTPDLTVQDCRRCLKDVIGDLPWCCTNKQGGRVLYPSCNVRYELYPFYITAATAPAPSPLAPPSPSTPSNRNGKGGMSSGTIVAIVVPVAVSVLLFVVGICFLSKRAWKKQYNLSQDKDDDITTLESMQFDFATLEAATNNFSDENKLGEGGFGVVYKGTLSSGKEIAVKRLSTSSGQGAEEFKNEVVVVAKLQHRNLVRLLGFCLEGEEKILVYEYVPNKSLDKFLFDPENQVQLDWSKRYKIIVGIARGILYLHEDSRLRIIHRDLKASNILLDGEMNPKVSDFGMARIFGVDQTQGNTSRIVGTYGYMSPEYAMQGEFSVKSDVYSFGVLLMEIISGKRNSSFCQSDGAEDLLSYVWSLWKEGTPLEMLDPTLRDSYTANEVMRCIHLSLLCVHEDPAERPTMATVALMLNSTTVTLPTPQQPAFFFQSTNPNMAIKGLEFDQSKTKSAQYSVNEMSVTEVEPR